MAFLQLEKLESYLYESQSTFRSFLENLELVNTREVCRFLEVSRLSFSQEYGPKLHEGFVMVRHLANLDIEVEDEDEGMAELHAFLENTWRILTPIW